MRSMWSGTVFTLGILVSGCGPEPTSFSVPSAAKSVERFAILEGHAFQTQFSLESDYPATPALEYFRSSVPKPWVLCEWGQPEWQMFVDGRGETPVVVHQLLHMWINREANRTLALSMRYYSAPESTFRPDNNTQEIILIEYLAPDIPGTIRDLKLKCEGSEASQP